MLSIHKDFISKLLEIIEKIVGNIENTIWFL